MTAITSLGTKVLVLDDDAASRGSTARVLATLGYVCVEAANGTEARVALDADRDISAMVYDIGLRDESGLELVEDLSTGFPGLTLVVTSGVDDPEVGKSASSRGASGYLVKPFEDSELVMCLEGALRRHGRDAAQRREAHALEQTIRRTRLLRRTLGALEGDSGASQAGDEEAIERLSYAVSLRDEETGRHIERMSRSAVVLAEAVKFRGLSPEHIRLAAALHDVGKIGVPDVILLKPGPLSSGERVVMQSHAQIGYQLLGESASSLLQAGAGIALTHHEWWDGRGYPRGLSGTEIPEEARIAAVADVFDALTNHRVYRPAMPIDEAIEVMRELRGRQFEPRLLDAFVECIGALRSIQDTYPELEEAHKRIRVLIVDDHTIFAQSLVRLLGARPELKVVGTAGSVTEAVAAALAYQPDVILMDFSLPDGDGAQATEQIKMLTPPVKIIMLTASDDNRSLARAIAAGCSGFVSKADAVDLLIEAIVAANDGEVLAPRGELVPLLRELRPTHRRVRADLTPREHDVLALMVGGSANKQIAEKLHLSVNTVRNYGQNILYKLNAHSKLEAVATAARAGIIDYPVKPRTGSRA